MDRLTAMRTFRTVVETGGFSAAARRLGLSKAAVSKQVAELEAHFGTALLQRTTRRLNATDAGRRYFENCVRLLDELTEVEAEVRTLADRAERAPAHQRADQFRQRGPRPCDLRHSAALPEAGDSGRAQRPVRRSDRGGVRRRAAHPHQPAGFQPDRAPPLQHHAVGLRGAQLSQAHGNAEDAGGSEVTRMPDLHPVDLAL